jgi:hypothetical protein
LVNQDNAPQDFPSGKIAAVGAVLGGFGIALGLGLFIGGGGGGEIFGVEAIAEERVEGIADEGGLSGSTDAAHHDETAEGDPDGEVMEVVERDLLKREPWGERGVDGPAFGGRDGSPSAEVLTGERPGGA